MKYKNKYSNSNLSILSSIFLTLLIFSTTSCFFGGSKPKEKKEKRKELNSVTKEALKGSAQELLDKGKEFYSNGLYSLAKDNFHSLLLRYPNSAYSEFAELKKADSLFYLGNYSEAASLYQIFFDERLGSQSRDYALFALGRSFEFSYKGIGREETPLERAKLSYEKLIKLYPKSHFTTESKKHLKKIQIMLDQAKVHIIQYYDKMGNEKAYLMRKKELEQDKF